MLQRCVTPNADVELPPLVSSLAVGEAVEDLQMSIEDGDLHVDVVELGDAHYVAGRRNGEALSPEEIEAAA